MANTIEVLKEQLQKKTLPEIEAIIMAHKQKIGVEKELSNLHRLNSELSVMQQVREHKLSTSGRTMSRNTTPAKPKLKSFDDYVKSKR